MLTPIHTLLSGKWSVLILRIVVLLCVFAASAGTTYASSVSGSDAPASKEENLQDKVVYLSFDDGPGNHTREVLDILRKEQVLATFFVLGEQAERYPEMIRVVVEDGHALGNHTFNHNYEQLYSDFKVFWKQIKQTESVVERITGFRPNLVRAPGGTYGHFDKSYFDLLKLGGYTVMDWNVDSGDSKRKGVPAKEILRNATKVPAGAHSVIVLMHDGGAHAETVKALPGIIKYYRDQGFRFDTMKASDEPVQFRIDSNGKYKSRKAPSKEWIAENVQENSNLWLAGKELKVEIGLAAATLKQGEFRVEDQRIMVPLRTFMKKFGGSARWNAETRTATAVWKDRTMHADSVSGDLTTKRSGQLNDRTTEGVVQSQGGTIWVPLRELMEHMGVTVDSLKANEKEWMVKASVPLAAANSMYLDKLI
ncbi:polysaccharide deacetylase family protein [Paenibacillus taichungensis]|uniref:polysaccharide deacetylase n=1 Tax=Paenibacillus TaxID=44249 RepID=UPI0013D34B9E|nr:MULTISPECIES: polysaccharide deacetylase [Paenibacillus]MEC0105492.1 polysaccharide deacetylase family protein [Paenibacillus taichungensis]MEC0197984.1 polysaccharide deacetylase family protein [Paenibacillus taichungensis]NEU65000.1 polysaccharide deacetylase [Paenibacillus sp. ALJ109b]